MVTEDIAGEVQRMIAEGKEVACVVRSKISRTSVWSDTLRYPEGVPGRWHSVNVSKDGVHESGPILYSFRNSSLMS